MHSSINTRFAAITINTTRGSSLYEATLLKSTRMQKNYCWEYVKVILHDVNKRYER